MGGIPQGGLDETLGVLISACDLFDRVVRAEVFLSAVCLEMFEVSYVATGKYLVFLSCRDSG